MNNLIGVSGKINSGKDVVGKALQYLESKAYLRYTFEKYCTLNLSSFDVDYYPTFEIRKFADKLKDIVCMLIGCTREQLEDREFKESTLGPEWDYYFAKDLTIGLYTKEMYEALAPAQKTWFERRSLTPRLLLQLLGTDCGRKIIHPNIWVNALFADYKPQDAPYNTLGDLFDDLKQGLAKTPNWIITDVRFPNEAEAIKQRGGILIRVDRPCKECGGMGYHKMDCNIGRTEHESEYSLDKYDKFDFKISNDGSLEDLVNKVKKFKFSIKCQKLHG